MSFLTGILIEFIDITKLHISVNQVLRGTKQHSTLEFFKLLKKCGSVVTFWIRHIPFVMIFDSDTARDTFKSNAQIDGYDKDIII